ncbi:hypothetical protein FQN57_007276 [Myotisia sp. PD_48]|nr:hypothetical protein FQN57_007276 [Myotisia sp. PD_48]
MKFSIAAAVLALATAVVAAPGYKPPTPQTPQDKIFVQNLQKFEKNCGNNNQVSCCNEENKSATSQASGGLLGILDNINVENFRLLSGCSKIDVAAVIGIQDLLNSKCGTKISCCESGDTNQNGLVNLDLKCGVHNLL